MKVMSKDDVVAAFLETALGNIHKTKFIRLTQFLVSLCDIGRNRHRCSGKLRPETTSLALRKGLTLVINCKYELMCLLPGYH